METIVGFVAGYLAGAQEGRDGLERLRTSLKAIAASPEAHRLAAEALTVAETVARTVARRAFGQGLTGLGGAVAGISGAPGHHAAGAAARGDGSRGA